MYTNVSTCLYACLNVRYFKLASAQTRSLFTSTFRSKPSSQSSRKTSTCRCPRECSCRSYWSWLRHRLVKGSCYRLLWGRGTQSQKYWNVNAKRNVLQGEFKYQRLDSSSLSLGWSKILCKFIYCHVQFVHNHLSQSTFCLRMFNFFLLIWGFLRPVLKSIPIHRYLNSYIHTSCSQSYDIVIYNYNASAVVG
jgi:hypothetical protein